MKYTSVLVTWGAWFVWSNLCMALKNKYPALKVIALDNLKRRWSELNLPRLKDNGIVFVHGDIRQKEDLEEVGAVDLLIECSAEPSVMAWVNWSPDYLLNTNLLGWLNCFEFTRKHSIDTIFISTSRVYPYNLLNELDYQDDGAAFIVPDQQKIVWVSSKWVNEQFPLQWPKTLYGATKLSCELFLQEYKATYGSRFIINRYGCIAWPRQMWKVDQWVMTLWVSRHMFKKPLSYIGFWWEGKQVRDFLHIDDMVDSILLQIEDFDKFAGKVFVIWWGKENSISLNQLAKLCQTITKNEIPISSDKETRLWDLKRYVSDYSYWNSVSGWKPSRNLNDIVVDTKERIEKNTDLLTYVL